MVSGASGWELGCHIYILFVLHYAPEVPRVISGRLYCGRSFNTPAYQHHVLSTGSRWSAREDRGGTDGRPGRSKWQRQVDPVSPVATPLRLHGWAGELSRLWKNGHVKT